MSADTNPNIEDVVTVVDNLDSDAPVAMEIEDKLTDVTSADPQQAHELVSDALDLDVLEEDDTRQGFGGIRLVDADADADVSNTDESTGEDVGFGDTNPRGETDKSLEERSLDAFAAAIEYFHSQLDRELPETYEGSPETPREYYEECRGWSKETIETKQLGYAPADENALLDYLMRQGFTGEEIQGTGLFYEGFTPHFQGRYVLPYFDAEGDPVYAISRSLAEDLDGHPGDRYGNQKYTKALKTKDRTFVDEPIFGAETVDSDTERLLVAGGIADAISLHEAGYSCVSPVTTVRFKAKHEPRIVDMVDRYDLNGVYMLNDAERPSVDETELPEGEHADSTEPLAGVVLLKYAKIERVRNKFVRLLWVRGRDLCQFVFNLHCDRRIRIDVTDDSYDVLDVRVRVGAHSSSSSRLQCSRMPFFRA